MYCSFTSAQETVQLSDANCVHYTTDDYYIFWISHLKKMMSPATILSAQQAASLQSRSFIQDLVGSVTSREAMATVDPAYITLQSICSLYEPTESSNFILV